jgi:hypothetical protein
MHFLDAIGRLSMRLVKVTRYCQCHQTAVRIRLKIGEVVNLSGLALRCTQGCAGVASIRSASKVHEPTLVCALVLE